MHKRNETVNSEQELTAKNDRRDFLKKAGNAALAAPAAAILVEAALKPKEAQASVYSGGAESGGQKGKKNKGKKGGKG